MYPVSTDTLLVNQTIWNVSNTANTYYFSVIDIDGSKVRVTSYGGQASPYQIIDYFPIPGDDSFARYLLLLQ
jgi:hypothetical protein